MLVWFIMEFKLLKNLIVLYTRELQARQKRTSQDADTLDRQNIFVSSRMSLHYLVGDHDLASGCDVPLPHGFKGSGRAPHTFRDYIRKARVRPFGIHRELVGNIRLSGLLHSTFLHGNVLHIRYA